MKPEHFNLLPSILYYLFLFQFTGFCAADSMARKRESLAELLCCVICLENYDEEGQHVPRLLPCSHTVCESCIKDLITNDTLVCPECRKKHRAENKEKSFPQNKYLLAHIWSGKFDAKESSRSTQKVSQERCEKHGMELVLF